MEDWNLSILKKERRCALRIENRGINHESHTLGVPLEAKQWRRIRRTGCILSDTWDVPLSPDSNIEMRQQYVADPIRRSCKGGERELRVNPGNPTACRRERIRMQHAERRTCRSGRTPLLSSSMTKHDLHLPKISELSASARWWHTCTQLAAASKERWHHWSISLPLSNNVNIDGANLSGCHRSQDGTCAHPAQSGQLERMIQGCDPTLEFSLLVERKRRDVREPDLYAASYKYCVERGKNIAIMCRTLAAGLCWSLYWNHTLCGAYICSINGILDGRIMNLSMPNGLLELFFAFNTHSDIKTVRGRYTWSQNCSCSIIKGVFSHKKLIKKTVILKVYWQQLTGSSEVRGCICSLWDSALEIWDL